MILCESGGNRRATPDGVRGPSLVYLLLDAGADMDKQSPKTGYTALHYCAENENEFTALDELMYQRGANQTLRSKKKKFTPLELAEFQMNSLAVHLMTKPDTFVAPDPPGVRRRSGGGCGDSSSSSSSARGGECAGCRGTGETNCSCYKKGHCSKCGGTGKTKHLACNGTGVSK